MTALDIAAATLSILSVAVLVNSVFLFIGFRKSWTSADASVRALVQMVTFGCLGIMTISGYWDFYVILRDLLRGELNEWVRWNKIVVNGIANLLFILAGWRGYNFLYSLIPPSQRVGIWRWKIMSPFYPSIIDSFRPRILKCWLC